MLLARQISEIWQVKVSSHLPREQVMKESLNPSMTGFLLDSSLYSSSCMLDGMSKLSSVLVHHQPLQGNSLDVGVILLTDLTAELKIHPGTMRSEILVALYSWSGSEPINRPSLAQILLMAMAKHLLRYRYSSTAWIPWNGSLILALMFNMQTPTGLLQHT